MSENDYNPFRGENQDWPKLVVAVVGPTASGKTNLALAIAREVGGFLISADARQIYKGMDIGTNKESIDVKRNGEVVPGFGLDLVKPNESYTVQQFQRDALQELRKPELQGLVPILVGGTGLWVSAVIDGLNIPAVAPNESLRTELETRVEREGLESLVVELFTKDPNLKGEIDQENPRRVIRALEIIQETGRPFSEQTGKTKPPFDTLLLMPKIEREVLDERIHARVMNMVHEGLVQEVEQLLQEYPRDLPSFSGIGYAEVIRYLDGLVTKEALIEEIAAHTRQYARRQWSWWRRESRIQQVATSEEAVPIVQGLLEKGRT